MKKFHQLLVSGAILLSVNGAISTAAPLFNPNSVSQVQAEVLGDNYPSKWKKESGIDSWNMYVRQCTSFVAFRLSSANGFQLPRGYGNAHTWGHIAKTQGYAVNKTPKVGSVAWFDKGANNSSAIYGHVSWVAEVSNDYVTLEEYNYNAGQGPEKYHKRQIHKSKVSGFIHFKDLPSTTSSSSVEINQPLSNKDKTLPKSGLYQFTQKHLIKGEAKIDSPDLGYYDAGQSVNYDQLLSSDGYDWLSYLSFSGNRRYIPLKKITEKSNTVEVTHAKTTTTTAIQNPIVVGDQVTFPGVFKVTQVINGLITSSQLAGGDPTHYNWIDPGPLTETDAKGNTIGDQILHSGEYFTVPGTYKVLKVDKPSNGIYVQMGSRGTWFIMDKAKKV
ncbi:SH3 domain-containing protein [Streptococcus ictaluri]|uniref:N-acetylmuramoyl-L-alanine amidase n=1 Tax=Streptococcus ictaluri 707-05 TaxID=764299 RepID=G5K5D4_9STRE|nr:SH3 domain-containing protein [Streptococcus ictaluri]EHI68814.1 CHAP domain protein [Streptococcus ictaluri 707-05]